MKRLSSLTNLFVLTENLLLDIGYRKDRNVIHSRHFDQCFGHAAAKSFPYHLTEDQKQNGTLILEKLLKREKPTWTS